MFAVGVKGCVARCGIGAGAGLNTGAGCLRQVTDHLVGPCGLYGRMRTEWRDQNPHEIVNNQ